MKKSLSVLLVLLLLSLCACANPQESSGETTDAASSSESVSSENEAMLPDSEWYLSETLAEDSRVEVSEEEAKCAVKVPITYETTEDGIRFRFDFFREAYTLGSTIQVRITVANERTEEAETDDRTYYVNSLSLGTFESDTAGTKGFISVLDPPCDKEYSYYTDNVVDHAFPVGGVLTFERAYTADPDYFAVGETYTFRFVFTELSPQHCEHTVEIPVEVVEVGS